MPLNGQRGVFDQPSGYGKTDSGGYSLIVKSGTKAEIRQLAAQLAAMSGVTYDVKESYEFAELTARVPNVVVFPDVIITNESPIDLWEYFGQEAQKDILECDVPSGITATLTQKNIESIRSFIQNPPVGSNNANTYPYDNDGQIKADSFSGTKGQISSNDTNAYNIYKLMQAGVRDGIISVPTLRHTQTVSATYPITLSQLNVGKILSTSTLIALENPPSWATAGLPSGIPSSLVGLQVKYGWRKKSPSIQQIANQKVQLIQEFEYGLWSELIVGTIL